MQDAEELAQRRAHLSAAKRALLDRRLQGEDANDRPPIIPRSPGASAPSFAQERLWLLHQLDPTSPAYNEFAAYRLHGPLDHARLNDTLYALGRRHAVLRTAFVLENARVTARVIDDATIRCTLIDLSGEDDPEATLAKLARSEARTPFTLDQPPLLRFTLVVIGPHEHAILLTMHHIVSDGWSSSILLKEFVAIYADGGIGSALPPLSIQYADFAEWQRAQVGQPRIGAQLSYWLEQLRTAPRFLELPTDYPRPTRMKGQGACYRFAAPPALTQSLNELTRASGATQFMALLAAFAVVLSRHSGATDLVIGSPVSNRTLIELESLIGCFINMLALRVDMKGDPTFADLLVAVRSTLLDALANQDVPFEHVVEHLQPPRSVGSTPVFQVVLSLQNFPMATDDPPGLRVERIPIETGTSKYDLWLTFEETADGLLGAVEFRTDLFTAATVERFTAHLLGVLEQAIADPTARVSTLRLLSPAERNVLADLAATDTSWRNARPVPRLFLERAALAPHACAVRATDRHVTYETVDRESTTLAGRLGSAGIGRDDTVGVWMQRTSRLPVALLAVLKSGGAYVPIDGRTPALRVAQILSSAKARILLTDEALLAHVPPGPWITWNVSDATGSETAPSSLPAVDDHDLAYVIYTSGSTGAPKGVQIEHHSLVNVLLAVGREIGEAAAGVMAAVTSVSFDIAALEIFLPLIHGGTVDLLPEAVCEDGAALSRSLTASAPAAMQATPSTWRMLLIAGWPGLHGLNILCGGEVLQPDLAEALLTRGARVWNLYGPTETTIWSTIQPVTSVADVIPIGRPLANTRAYILGSALEEVPIGVKGELYLGGAGVARGYLNRRDLTAERFVPDPFGAPGSRMYRTGDVVRVAGSGTIEFCGRVDAQLKVRGFRVEPGEIEVALREHESVADVAVTTDATGVGLIAHVQVKAGDGVASRDLQAHLANRLPSYMVPSRILFLETLPRTSSGKIDRTTLSSTLAPVADQGHRVTADLVEDLLSSIVASVLELPRMSPDANFFESGGHSLLAAQVVARIGEVFGVEIPLRELFESPTIGQLGNRISSALRERSGAVRKRRIPTTSASDSYPLTLGQEHLWNLYRANRSVTHHTLSHAVRLRGHLDLDALHEAIGEITERHSILRAVFSEDQGRVTQRVSVDTSVPIVVSDLSELPDEEREHRIQSLLWTFSRLSFDLERGSPLRFLVLRIRHDEHVLALVVHHIVCDGWSLSVLRRDLRVLYEARRTGTPAALPALPVQYFHYAAWQRDEMADEMTRRASSWLQSRSLARPPADPVSARTRSFRYATEWVTLDATATAHLRQSAQRDKVSEFMTLFAALVATLRMEGRHDEVCVGTLAANRVHPETHELVGLFVNTIPICMSAPPEISLGTLVAQTRMALLEGYAHQDVPFELLVDGLRSMRIMDELQTLVIDQPGSAEDREISELSSMDVPIVRPGISAGEAVTIPSTFALIVEIERLWNTHRLSVKYSLDVMDRDRVRDLLRRFENVLAAIAAEPNRRLCDTVTAWTP